ncbi:MAG: cyclic nucleotide-binding domain-containing protein [Anaerolineae bacterium]|nr:cyclic nucleotide-binding domain-containing protein [Anaerolineae bacterium]
MFWDLEEEGEQELLRLVPHVEQHAYDIGDVLLREEEIPNKTVVILEGRVRVTHRLPEQPLDLQDLGERVAGAAVGRTSLEAGAIELVTVEALAPTLALVLPFRDLIRIYQQSRYLREHLATPLKPNHLVATLQKIPLFGALSDRAGELELYSVAQITHEQVFGNGEWLFRQGEISDRLVLILSGRIQLSAVDQEGVVRDLGTLGPGDEAGETGLLVGDFHDVTAVADGYARVVYLLRSEFADLLAQRPYLRRRLMVSEEVEKRRNLRQFDWIRDDEWVIAVVQRHWTRLLSQTGALVAILFFLLPAVMILIITGGPAGLVIAAILSLPILGLCLGMIWQYINWRDDFFVVTTQRVIHIERVGPFSTQQEESALENIEDLYEIQPGFAANLLGYGNLVLQTAGETVAIDMSYIPHPGEMRRLISQQIERSKARNVLRTRGQIRDMLARRLVVGESSPHSPEAATHDGSTAPRTSFLPAILVNSIWEYFFPASWVATDGDTIIWRRFWLPGLLRYSAPFLIFLVSTIGGIVVLGSAWGAENFLGWMVAWLVLEAVVFGVLLWFVEDWRNDYFQLTPSHIILVERRPLLLQESRHEARLDRIQNLAFEVPSIFARALNYGHVQFETAGTQGKFELKFVRRPEEVQSTISNRQHAYRQHQREIESNRRQQEMLTWFATYDDLHRDIGPDGG